MKKAIILAATIAASFSATASDLYSKDLAKEVSGYSMDQLSVITKKLNKDFAKDMPIQIDEFTTIESMYFMSSNKSINYNATVNLDNNGLNIKEVKSALKANRENVVFSICNMYSSRTMLEAGFVVNYRYTSNHSKYITSLTINKKDCK